MNLYTVYIKEVSSIIELYLLYQKGQHFLEIQYILHKEYKDIKITIITNNFLEAT